MTLEASNPNSHSHVCGNQNEASTNTGGVEYIDVYILVFSFSTPSGVEK
jgi:hypothetical protein